MYLLLTPLFTDVNLDILTEKYLSGLSTVKFLFLSPFPIVCFLERHHCAYFTLKRWGVNLHLHEGLSIYINYLNIFVWEICLSYPIPSHPIPSYPIPSYPVLSYPILPYPILPFIYISMDSEYLLYTLSYKLLLYYLCCCSRCCRFDHRGFFHLTPEYFDMRSLRVCTSLLSGIIRCFRLILYSFCPSHKIGHIFKDPWLLLLQSGIRNEHKDFMCAHCL